MSKLSSASRIPEQYRKSDLFSILTQSDAQINALSEGRISANYNAGTAAPTSSLAPNAQGDKVWKTNVTVQGSAGVQYVTLGWVCVASGSPGTFVEMRVLTGT